VVKPCGRAPHYSGKLIARAVDLYNNGVKPGYMRWDELQSTLEKEFPGEFKVKGEDKPLPETVLGWVHKYPDAPERLKQLRVQQADQTQPAPTREISYNSQLWPTPVAPNRSSGNLNVNALFGRLMLLFMIYFMARFVTSALSD
jgi:hypothetical protein